MKLIFATRNLDPKEKRTFEYDMKEATPRIKKRVGSTCPGTPLLRARLSSTGSNGNTLYTLTLSMQLPNQPVVVQKSDKDLRILVTEAEKAMKKELRRVTSRIRKDHLARRRSSSREAFQEFTEEVASIAPEAASFEGTADNPLFARLRPLMGPLYNYAREQITTAEIGGDIPFDYLNPTELVDQAMVAVIDSGDLGKVSPSALEQRLYRSIESSVRSEIERHAPDDKRMVSLSEAAPFSERVSRDQPEVEESEFYQPYESLIMQDVLVDEHAVDPEHAMSDTQQHELILRNLSSFAPEARTAFMLSRFEGFDLFEIAMIQDRSEEVVLSDIDSCATALQEGWTKAEDDVTAPL